jgi:hypothetical protein
MTIADARDRAFCLCMATGGMRESELVQLKKENFDFTHKPTKVTIQGTKTKNKSSRITFISGEATNALLAWMRIRSDYITKNQARFTALRKHLEDKYQKQVSSGADDGRIFPYTEERARVRWCVLLEKAGVGFTKSDPTKGDRGVYELHLYVLRKFFNTRLKKVIPELVVKKLMGHESELEGSYDRYTEEELAEWYSKGQSALYILEAPENQEAVENVQSQMETLQRQVAELLKQSQWYKQNAMESIPVEPDRYKMDIKTGESIPVGAKREAVPLMTDKEALAQYTKEQKIMEEIDKDGPEIWAMRKRNEIRQKQRERKNE